MRCPVVVLLSSLLLLVITHSALAAGPSLLVKGNVTDAVTGDPVPGATVRVPETLVGTSADQRGHFRLHVPDDTHALQVSAVGYRVASVTLSGIDAADVAVSLIPSTVLLDEIPVTGERPPMSTVHGLGAISISPRRTETLGGAMSDVYRTMQTMAGVTANNEMSSRFNVRGGSSDDNLILLGGIQVIAPFHLKESPNSSLSAINTGMLKQILFLPAGFPARYGDRISAVVDMDSREGGPRFGGEVEASLTNGGVLVEGPLAPGVSGILGARATYSDYIARYLLDGASRKPSFYDLQGNIGADLGANTHLTVGGLFAHDMTSGIVDGSYDSWLATTRLVSRVSPMSTVTARGGIYRQTEDLVFGQEPTFPGNRLSATNAFVVKQEEASVQLETQLSGAYSVVAGGDLRASSFDLTRGEVFVTDSMAGGSYVGSGSLAGAFVENHVSPVTDLLLNAGLRIDHSSLTNETRISPRLLLALRTDPTTTLKAAWGIYCQSPIAAQLLAARRAGFGTPRMQRAMHFVLGLERALRQDLSLRVEAYYKTLDDLISFDRLRSGEIVYSGRNDARGRIRGIDIEASFNDPRVMGWLNVSFLSAREINDFDGKGWRFLPTDQTNTVTAVFEYRIPPAWAFNLRALYGSGFAYVDDLPALPGGRIDTKLHYPEYKRADVRISYSHAFDRIRGTLFLEIQNVFGQRNALTFNGETNARGLAEVNVLLPTVVNVGMKVEM